MSDDVAAVLAGALCVKHESPQPCSLAALYGKPMLHPECALAALAAAGYAVVAVPEASSTVEAVVKHHACSDPSQAFSCGHSTCILASLSCSGYAVVKVPGDTEVKHGARLVLWSERFVDGKYAGGLYVIEDTP